MTALDLTLRHDLIGAPFRIGQRVVIRAQSGDDSFDPRFHARVGVVRAFHYDCADPRTFPSDPMIVVEVAELGEDLFFARELAPLQLEPLSAATAP